MSYAILPTKKAIEETEDAAIYYEGVRPGLGFDFLNEVEERYKAISKNPFAYSYIDERNIIRDAALKRFPYVIIFSIEQDSVIVLSVHQTQQRPIIST